ncbi:hypothetical protein AL036_10965 [Salipiger aestuarii]|uniref:Uncharacterized protein n=1 Tax=Salipiger aestuarii TaxID=568098 RepID=A0A327Y899_9RHOB|nr:hypothetical protein [Salipiger aestuarii]EIE50917.1 hypothetical protein C357_11329 [Citreicella sp. 357]KAA8607404.1 hypothetical protein AL036_10965 [Salipiger aestuarii]KAA8612110.1 hypothetical protein AL037_08425 [Salipiger aestuarii]KAB2541743.1 hypothetical protein AL035_10620 [Salipiger aestuarii]RAK17260.1 hypothetical protein ATI53_101558 [Salipiger aestuarii]
MFEPTPLLLAFLLFKRFIFLELVGALALVRVLRAGGPSRWTAAAALVLAVLGCIVLLAPVAGPPQGALYGAAARLMALGGGMLPLFVPSVFLAISAYLPGRDLRGIDIAHIALLWVLVGLWIASKVV